MGLTKQYRRFVLNSTFGVIGSSRGGLQRIPDKSDLVVTARNEDLVMWNVSTGEIVSEFKGEKHQVTCIRVSKGDQGRGHRVTLAAGYQDGAIRLFDINRPGDCKVTFHGHKSGITSLAFDGKGLRLASGSNDGNVILWDVVNESGLFKLKGHKAPITKCWFMSKRNVLVTSSRDTLIKFWDLDIQHCFNTIAAHVKEVWDFVLIKEDRYLVSTSSDPELKVWKLTFESEKKDEAEKEVSSLEPDLKKLRVKDENETEDLDLLKDKNNPILVEKLGSILRSSAPKKVSNLEIDPTGRILTSFSGDNLVELFLICSDEEVKKRCQKRAKKERRKLAKKSDLNTEDVALEDIPEPTLQEEFRRLSTIKANGKVKAISSFAEQNGGLKLYFLTLNNKIEKYSVVLGEKDAECNLVRTLDHEGHRSDIRTIAFSSENTALVSGSHETVKLWGRNTQRCIRTISSGYCLSSLFAPGDRQVVVGTKTGSIQIVDVASAEVIEDIEEAHAKEIWGLSLNADQKGFVSASADQTVKFWTFELVSSNDSALATGKTLSIMHQRTLKLEEDATDVKQSEDGRLIAVALLDSTIKVFFVDSLKFFLSLYGHRLPVTSLDISTDSTLLVSGSSDKNIKIWGLDFGDCHKSIFAHEGPVTAVKFIPNTHMFFTAGKEGKIKQWDADNFERIVTLDGHFGEVWGLAVSPNGVYLASASHDKTLKLWERSDEILVLEDERETEREIEGQEELATGDERVLPGHQDKESQLASVKTVESERGAELLMEAISMYMDYQNKIKEWKDELKLSGRSLENATKPPLPPLMAAYQAQDPDDYMSKMIARIMLNEIEQTLIVFPFDVVINLLQIMESLLLKNLNVEVVCRMFFFMIEIHFGPLSMAKDHFPLLRNVRKLVDQRLTELKDKIGFNNAALQYHLNAINERQRALELMDSIDQFKQKRRKKRMKQKAQQTAIMSL